MRREGLLYLTLVVLMWGMSFVATKVMVMHMPPITSGFLRFAIAGAILSITIRGRANYNRRERLFVVLGGLFGITLYFVFENIGLKFTTATNGALIVSSTPVWYLMARDLLDRRLSPPIRYLGTLMAFFGVALIVIGGRISLHINPIGDMLVLGAALAWTLYSLSIEHLSHHPNPIITRDISLWGLMFFIPFVLAEMTFSPPTAYRWTDPAAVAALLYLSIFCSALGYLLFNRAVTILGGRTANNGLYFIPLVTAIAETILLKTYPGIHTITGGLLIILGTYVAEQG